LKDPSVGSIKKNIADPINHTSVSAAAMTSVEEIALRPGGSSKSFFGCDLD